MPLPLRNVAKVARADQPDANLSHPIASRAQLAKSVPLPEHVPRRRHESEGGDDGARSVR
jgi:hypothetical protein